MNIPLTLCHRNTLALLREVGREAGLKGLRAYAVGGFVRDLLLKCRGLDLDIAVEGEAALEFAKYFAEKNKAGIVTYQQFGTATVFLPGGFQFDVVAARKERYPFSGSLPVVEPGSVFNDLFRRDFTVNAMALSVNLDTFGELVDYFSGLKDLKEKKIRVLHPKSFIDDPTRILRAVRFEQRLGFRIEAATLRLLKEALKAKVVSGVKPQRYFEEFKKILTENDPAKPVKRLYALNGLGFLGLRLNLSRKSWKLFHEAQRQISWFKRNFSSGENLEAWLVYFMVLIDNLSAGFTGSLTQRFNLKKEDREKLLLSRNLNGVLKKLAKRDLAAYEVYKILRPLGYEAILLCRAKAKGKNSVKRIDKFLLEDKKVKPYLKGEDLLRLGVCPGKKIGLLLEKILQARINGQVKTRFEEIKLMKDLKDKIGGFA